MASFYLNYRERTIRAHKRRAEYFIVSNFPHLLLKRKNPTSFYSLPNSLSSGIFNSLRNHLFSDKWWVTLNTAPRWGPAVVLTLVEQPGDFGRVLNALWHPPSPLHGTATAPRAFLRHTHLGPSNPQRMMLGLCWTSSLARLGRSQVPHCFLSAVCSVMSALAQPAWVQTSQHQHCGSLSTEHTRPFLADLGPCRALSRCLASSFSGRIVIKRMSVWLKATFKA